VTEDETDRGPTRVVALDGPAGSGKSTVARRVAAELAWRFVDTGATYRALTLAVLRDGVDPADGEGVLRVAGLVRVGLGLDPRAPSVLLDGQDVTREIRTAQVTAQVSAVSGHPAVREVLLHWQRAALGRDGAVAEGRDVASRVAPRAAVKVYLDADPAVRARRRAGDGDPGVAVTSTAGSSGAGLEPAVAVDLARRDALDGATNPLRAVDGAVHLDSSALSIDEVVRRVLDLVAAAGLDRS